MVTVAYKTNRGKIWVETFEDKTPDRILSTTTRKPPIPHNYTLLQVGLGDFVDSYTKRWKCSVKKKVKK